jgi:hypothetical protein
MNCSADEVNFILLSHKFGEKRELFRISMFTTYMNNIDFFHLKHSFSTQFQF